MAGPCADEVFFPPRFSESQSRDWAKAVNAIFKISKGDLVGIRVYGGRDLAFLAAIAHWLFDLRVWIELPDGTTTFANCRQQEQAQVCLHYADTGKSEALLQMSSTTFVLRDFETSLPATRTTQ